MRLARVFLGSLARRRLATLFSLAAIVLGVALGMAVQAVHEAALSEFGRGLRSMAGAADLQIVGPRGGFDEALYARLAARAVRWRDAAGGDCACAGAPAVAGAGR
jgi:putative ABC transport system permease protein